MKKISALFVLILFLSLFYSSSQLFAADLPLSDVSFRLGLHFRLRPEHRENFDFKKSEVNKQTLQRSRVDFGLRYKFLEGFVQLQHSGKWRDTDVFENTDDENVVLQQGYFAIHDLFVSHLTLKAGIQTLSYGRERLLGENDWSNTGNNLTGFKLAYDHPDVHIHFIDAKFKDGTIPKVKLDGFYSMFPISDFLHLDFYYFHKMIFQITDIKTDRAGVRVSGDMGDWISYDAEGVYEFGRVNHKDRRAFAAEGEGDFHLIPGRFDVFFKYTVASGDTDPDDEKDETFDNLYPSPHPQLGFMDAVSWKNIEAWTVGFFMKLPESFSLRADYHVFKLLTDEDSFYDTNGNARIFSHKGRGRDLGEELDLTLFYTYRDLVDVQAGFYYFYSGDYITTATGRDTDSYVVFIQFDVALEFS